GSGPVFRCSRRQCNRRATGGKSFDHRREAHLGAAGFQRVLQLASLGENWDGRGSSRVAPDTLAFVLVLLTQTMPPNAPAPGMIPLGKGGVQLVWHTVDAELEVEVVKPNDVYIYYLDCASGVE